MNYPSGVVTFLFTDIEGSTKLAQEFPETLHVALQRHHEIVEAALLSNNGFVFEIVGDAFCAAFENAEDAVKAAIELQKNLNKEKWIDAVIKIRIGIHSGNAEWNGKDYMGYITLARTARVMSAAYGEQILVSNDTYELCKYHFVIEKNNNISFRDLGERRLKDVIQPIRLYQVNSSELREDFPPLKTLDSRPNNLPVQLTSFIGRKDVLKEVKILFKDISLLTIIGSGGSGKTRLAMQLGAELIDDFSNGVFIVEFANISESSLVMKTLLNSLGIEEAKTKSLEDVIIDYLKDKKMLLLLDNCEHLIVECAHLAEMILIRCPDIKIIATSREALKCRGELTYRLPSLSLPDINESYAAENLTQFDSVRLFIERALAVNPSFRVNNDNAPALAQICNRLDGIPLAIELAAARIKIMNLHSIYERLDNIFKLLTGGRRTALPRQQTLKALIDWSYDLLAEQEKILWRRLSVFSGGWTFEAVEEVCSDEQVDDAEILDLLNFLAEKSIIIYDEVKDRYKFLETIKQYGEDKLKESGEEKKIFQKHYEYFIKLSEKADLKLNGNEVKYWLEILEAEHGNFQSALERSIKEERTEDSAALAGSLGNFWIIRGHYSVARILMENILTKKTELNKVMFERILSWLGTLTKYQGDYEKSQLWYEENLAINQDTDDKSKISEAYRNLGNLALVKADFENGKKFTNEGLKISREINDRYGIASALGNLGSIALFQGDYEKSQEYLNECLPIIRETGNKRELINTLITSGNLSHYKGDFDNALKFYSESLSLSRELGNKRGIVASLSNSGNILFFRCEYESAKKLFEESLPLSKEIHDVAAIQGTMLNIGNVAFYTGDYETGKKCYEECISLARELGSKRELSSALQNLGLLLLELRDLESAEKYFNETLILRRETGDKLGNCETLQNLGNLEYFKGNFEKADEIYAEGLDLFQKLGNKVGTANILAGLGQLNCDRGEYEKARKCFEESELLSRRYGSDRDVAIAKYGFGKIAFKLGKNTEAKNFFEESLKLRQSAKDKNGVSISLYGLGILANANGNYQESQKFLNESLEIRKEIGYNFGCGEIYLRLAEIEIENGNSDNASELFASADEIIKSMKVDFDKDEKELFLKIKNELKK